MSEQWSELSDYFTSDTTAVTLTYTLRELILHPEILNTLRSEILPFVYDDGTVDHTGLHKCKYLLAVIDETLRLYPPTPSGLTRVAPPEGLVIGDTLIPGDTIVNLPFYSLFRNPVAFVQPDSFIPERWTSRSDLVKDRRAFVPFSTGPFSCVGKTLAYMEMREVLARIVSRFDITFAPGRMEAHLLRNRRITFCSSWRTCGLLVRRGRCKSTNSAV